MGFRLVVVVLKVCFVRKDVIEMRFESVMRSCRRGSKGSLYTLLDPGSGFAMTSEFVSITGRLHVCAGVCVDVPGSWSRCQVEILLVLCLFQLFRVYTCTLDTDHFPRSSIHRGNSFLVIMHGVASSMLVTGRDLNALMLTSASV